MSGMIPNPQYFSCTSGSLCTCPLPAESAPLRLKITTLTASLAPTTAATAAPKAATQAASTAAEAPENRPETQPAAMAHAAKANSTTMFMAMTLKVPSPRPWRVMAWQRESSRAHPASSCTKRVARAPAEAAAAMPATWRVMRAAWAKANAMEAARRLSSSSACPQSSTSCWKGGCIMRKKNTARPPFTLGTVPSVKRLPDCPSHRGPKMSNVLRPPSWPPMALSAGSCTA
mmetsp:Transcript_28711/g.80258  ORF Transcript_28711/g.80258 Transcript_28711/m.80258 type:complete len:231 (+) Transcript_28711:193-885(+)